MKLFTNNWKLKLMALALAMVLWSHVRGEVNPWEEATFKIPLEAHPPAEMVIVNAGKLPRTVKVAVRAPRLTLRQLKGVAPPNPFASLEEAPLLQDRQIRAELDFSVAGPGQQKVSVEARSRLDDVQIMGVNPDSVTVVLDRAADAEFRIQSQLSGADRAEYYLTDVTINPTRVQVLGLSSEVAQVARVLARIAPADLAVGHATTLNVPLVAVNEKGVALNSLRLRPDLVEWKGTLRDRQATRAVRVVARPGGAPAEGWHLDDISVQPAEIQVRGAKRIVDPLEEVAAPVDVSGLTSTTRRYVMVSLPAGVTAVASPRVRVDIVLKRETPAPRATPAATR